MNPPAPVILVFSATTGYQLRAFDEAAHRAGVGLMFATDRCHALDDPWQDRAVPVRFEDLDGSVEAVVRAVSDTPVAGVIAVGDRPVRLAAAAAHALGLPWHPPESVRRATDKLAARRALAAAGLPSPWFLEVDAVTSAEEAGGDPRVGYPCVLKPTGLSGSRGVIRADDRAQFVAALGRIRRLLARPDVRAGRRGAADAVIVEGFIAGAELAVEGLLTRGELQVLTIFEKPDPLDGPYFEETIYLTPARLPAPRHHAVVAALGRAAAALGLWHGPIHAECRVTPDAVVMLEIAPRPIGGLCARVLRLAAGGGAAEEGRSLEELLLRHAAGEDVSGWRREAQPAAVMMIPIPARGQLRAVDGVEAARALPGVEDVLITAKTGQLLEPLPEAGSYLGFIFVRAATVEAADAAVRAAHRQLAFSISPAIDVRR